MLRILALIGVLAVVSGCQTSGTDTAGALSSAAGNADAAAANANGDQPALEQDGQDVAAGGETSESADGDAPQGAEASAVAPVKSSSADPVVAGVQTVASIRNEKGEGAAILKVLDCYKQARERSVSLALARICAAQDFVVSREVISNRPANATGTNDRPLLVSKRHAERIGALMKLKGMNQNQFNTFGAYLHAVAEPEYQKARKP